MCSASHRESESERARERLPMATAAARSDWTFVSPPLHAGVAAADDGGDAFNSPTHPRLPHTTRRPPPPTDSDSPATVNRRSPDPSNDGEVFGLRQEERKREAVEASPAQKSMMLDLPFNEGDAPRKAQHLERLEAVKQELASWEELRRMQEAVMARMKAEQQDEGEALASIVAQLEEERQAQVRVLQNRLRYYEDVPSRKGREDVQNSGESHSQTIDNKVMASDFTASTPRGASSSLQSGMRGGREPSACENQITRLTRSTVRNQQGSALNNEHGRTKGCTSGNSPRLGARRNDVGVQLSFNIIMENLGRLLASCCDGVAGLGGERRMRRSKIA